MSSPAPKATCQNCGAVLQGEFCHDCGQSARLGRLSTREWLRDVWSAVTELDTKLLRTLKGLTLRPGRTARAYVDGQRVRYTKPLTYSITTAALWAVATPLANPEAEGALRLQIDYQQLINLALLPVVAVAFHVAFLGKQRSYAEHLCLTMYVIGHVFLFRALLALVAACLPADMRSSVNVVDFFVSMPYMTWALFTFHEGPSRTRWLRTLLAIFLMLFVATPLVALIQFGLARLS